MRNVKGKPTTVFHKLSGFNVIQVHLRRSHEKKYEDMTLLPNIHNLDLSYKHVHLPPH